MILDRAYGRPNLPVGVDVTVNPDDLSDSELARILAETGAWTISIDLHLPDDDGEAAALIEAAERLYPGQPLGVFWLNHLRLLLEDADYSDRDDEWRV
jgi:hypothetical protein